jgi:hypothetical protein
LRGNISRKRNWDDHVESLEVTRAIMGAMVRANLGTFMLTYLKRKKYNKQMQNYRKSHLDKKKDNSYIDGTSNLFVFSNYLFITAASIDGTSYCLVVDYGFHLLHS